MENWTSKLDNADFEPIFLVSSVDSGLAMDKKGKPFRVQNCL